VLRFFGPYPYRSAFGESSEAEERERVLAHLSEVVTLEGPQSIASALLEPVVGTNGILVPPPG
jgi:taurine--2-oxoglutarate transaminase